MKFLTREQITDKISFYIYFGILIVFFSLLLNLPYFHQLNNMLLDQLHGDIKVRQEVVVIGIDDKSLQDIGAWPWNRSIFAVGLDNLKKSSPKVTGLDVLFLEDREGDKELETELKNVNFPVVFASKLIDDQVLVSKFKGMNVSDGLINFISDTDGKIRTSENIISYANDAKCSNSFSFQIFTTYLGEDKPVNCDVKAIDAINKSFKLKNDQFFNYASSPFTYYSFSDLYNNKIDPNNLKDKIVLIGSTATDLKNNLSDNFTDVFGKRISGIEIHANIINSLLEHRFQQFISGWIYYPGIYAVCAGLLFLYRRIRSNKIEFAVYAASITGSIVLGIALFNIGVNWYFVSTLGMLTATYIYMIAFKYLIEQRQNRFIQKAFSQYINPALLQKLVEKPDILRLGGEKKVITVLFSDIRGFTSISEKLQPERLINLINEYLDLMCEIILQNNGTIDKFIGDAIMAFWNAPLDEKNHQYLAVKTALEMHKKMKEFNEESGMDLNLKIGIGINTGEMIVGNVGSRKRFDYTLLGDNVNLGSRLENLNKKYGGSIIITESVMNGMRNKDDFCFRILDEVIVKGRSLPVKIYEPMFLTEENEIFCGEYAKAFDEYQKGNFEDAILMFSKFGDPTSKMMIDRIKNLEEEDIENWRGVWTWNDK